MADRRTRFIDEQRAPQDGLHYDGVGASLRHARERLGLDLTDIALALRIQQGHLDALERGRFHELPGPTYAVGFVRSYARYLRLDGEAAVEQFKAETSIAPGPGRLVAPEPIGEARRPRGLLIAISLLLAAMVYGGWMWLQERDRLTLERVSAPPQSAPQASIPSPPPPETAPTPAAETESARVGPSTPPAPEPQSAAAPAAAVPTAPAEAPASIDPAPAIAAPAGPAAVPQGAAEDEEESTPPPSPNSLPGTPPAALPPPQVAAATPAGTGQTYGAANHDARVVIRATAESWVQVKGADNEILLTRTLRPGDTYLAPNRSDITLWTGNAGALEILLDGTSLPPLGGMGVPKRGISLDPARLAATAD